jgi:hypothetical protein
MLTTGIAVVVAAVVQLLFVRDEKGYSWVSCSPKRLFFYSRLKFYVPRIFLGVVGVFLLYMGIEWYERVTWRWGIPDEKLHAIDTYNDQYFDGLGKWEKESLVVGKNDSSDAALRLKYWHRVEFAEVGTEWVARDFSVWWFDPDNKKDYDTSEEMRILRGDEWINLVEEE